MSVATAAVRLAYWWTMNTAPIAIVPVLLRLSRKT